MSLRARLFLLFGSLLAALLGAQWWMLRSLAHDIDAEATALAVAVGESIVSVLEDEHRRGDGAATRTVRVQVVPKDGGSAGDEEAPEAAAESTTRVLRLVQKEIEALEGSEPRRGRETRTLEREILHLADEPRDELVQPPPAPGAAGPGLVEPPRPLDPVLLEPIPFPVHSLEQRVRRFTNRMLAGTGGLLLLGLVVAGIFAHRISRPLRQLAAAAGQVGEGELGVRVDTAAGGEIGDTVHAFNRMSDRLRQLEDDARRLRADQHLSELGEVSRGLAHSLRNPLNALGLSLERLADADLDLEDRQQLAATARQQIRRVDGSLRSFLALASSGSVAEEEIDVAALIQDVALEALQDVRASGSDAPAGPRLETEIAAGLPPLRAVLPELRAVLQALVVNALEASPPGGRVRLRASPSAAAGIRIEVEDEGPGLSAQVRRRLFSPHVTTKEQGSGMGLFLAQRIAANRYGGSLELVDAHGEASGTLAILQIGPRAARRKGDT